MGIRHTAMLPYEDLRNAIVILAAEDYRTALFALKSNPGNEDAYIAARECERFFTSDWYRSICSVSGEMIMTGIQKEAEEYEY